MLQRQLYCKEKEWREYLSIAFSAADHIRREGPRNLFSYGGTLQVVIHLSMCSLLRTKKGKK
jgi:hypothetical protein